MTFRQIKPGDTLYYYDAPYLTIVFILKKDKRYVWFGSYAAKGDGGFTYEEQKTTFDYWDEDHSDAQLITTGAKKVAIMNCFGDLMWDQKMLDEK